MIAVTVCYASEIAFQEEYYLSTHMDLVARNLSPLGLRKAEARKVVATANGAPAPYQMVATLYFDDLSAFQAASRAPAFKEVVDDVANFYAGQPDILIGPVVAAL